MNFFTLPTDYIFFEEKYSKFVDRVNKSNNMKLLKVVNKYDKSTGLHCISCDKILPLYRFRQAKKCKFGVEYKKCLTCIRNDICPFKLIYVCNRSSSLKRFNCYPDYDEEYLKNYFKKTDGRCAISGIKMSTDYASGNPLAMSIERLNNDLPYTKENIVLICACFQVGQTYNFSIDDMREILYYDSSNDGFVFDEEKFLVDVNNKTHIKLHTKNLPFTKNRRGEYLTKTCNYCTKTFEIGKFYYFTNRKCYSLQCKDCKNLLNRLRKKSVRGFIQKMVGGAKYSASKRSKVTRTQGDTSNEVESDLFDAIVELVIKQGGRCAYTGIPLVFKTYNKFSPSLDRIENDKGYVRGNIQIIVTPLNTALKPSLEQFLEIRSQ